MKTELLNQNHNRKKFICGIESLDFYLHKQANQDIKRKLAACFILPDLDGTTIKGYYTLSNASIGNELIPKEFSKRLPPSYLDLPVTLLGRLAVDQNFQNSGIGKFLLVDALKRSLEVSRYLGSFAVIVDPIDNRALKFYDKFGFIELPDSMRMFLPMKSIELLSNT